MATRVVLVDDDLDLSDMLCTYLQAEGFEMHAAHNGQQALETVASQKPDLVVLDIMMPHLSGLDVLRHLRVNSLLPIIMLTARGDDSDCIAGLNLGADDYINKPCSPAQLVARIHAVLRRTGLKHHRREVAAPITAGPFVLSPTQRTVEYMGRLLPLTSTEFTLLSLLIHHAGAVVSKATLSQQGLGRPLRAYDRTVDVHISNIRSKLGQRHFERSSIETVVRQGYQLLLD